MLLELHTIADIPLINISKSFYVFPCDEPLEPSFVKLPKCDQNWCNTVLFGRTEQADVELVYRTAPEPIVQSSWRTRPCSR